MKYFVLAVGFVALVNILAPTCAYPAHFSRQTIEDSLNEVGLQLINDSVNVSVRIAHVIVDSKTLDPSEVGVWQAFITKWEGTQVNNKTDIIQFTSELSDLPLSEMKLRLDNPTKDLLGEMGLSFGRRSLDRLDDLKDQIREEISKTTDAEEKEELLSLNQLLSFLRSMMNHKVQALKRKFSQ